MISLLTLPVRLPLKAIVAVAEHLLATPPIPGVMLWQELDQPGGESSQKVVGR